MKSTEKKQAIILREKGESIKVIAKKLGVSKGSVSVWVRSVELSDKVKKALFLRGWTGEAIERRRFSRIKNEEAKRAIIINKAKNDFDKISLRDLKIVGSMLYWAEGGKTNRGLARFSNSDPFFIKVVMKFFRLICRVPESKFRAHIHTFSHLNAKIAENYWSDVTGIPLSQFYKTYSKPSKASLGKSDSLPYGTLDISVCDTKLFLTIFGWTQKIGQLILEE